MLNRIKSLKSVKTGPALLALASLLLLTLAFAAYPPGIASAQYPGFGDPGSLSSKGNSAGLTPIDETVEGGSIPFGATGQVVVRFKNEGGGPIETGLIRLYPSSTVSAEVALNQCGEGALEPGAECAIALSVKALQSGPWRIEMLMKHSGRSKLVATTVSGSVEQGSDSSDRLRSDIETIPEEVDFGSLEESQSLVEPVVLRNITSNPITITRLFIDTSEQAGYTLKSECDTLEAGQACIAMVTWSPKLKGRSSGVLVAEHSGPTGISSVLLKGEFDPTEVEEAEIFPNAVPGKGLLVASQTQIDFGSDVESASTITVSLVNSGDTPLKLNDIRISGTDNGLGYKQDGCMEGDVLLPIEACPLTITWSPTRVGPVFDDVQVRHDGARGVLVIPIRGEAISTVSQDQKSIVLNQGSQVMTTVMDGSSASASEDAEFSDEEFDEEIERNQRRAASNNSERAGQTPVFTTTIDNPQSVLDGYRITSFSRDRAIINGPGGSRIVFNNEQLVLGGILWFVKIKREGIEFAHNNSRVLMLFDRSLSSINRVNASDSSSGNNGAINNGN